MKLVFAVLMFLSTTAFAGAEAYNECHQHFRWVTDTCTKKCMSEIHNPECRETCEIGIPEKMDMCMDKWQSCAEIQQPNVTDCTARCLSPKTISKLQECVKSATLDFCFATSSTNVERSCTQACSDDGAKKVLSCSLQGIPK